SPSIATCTAWCTDPNNPNSGDCLALGVRYYKGIAPISEMVSQAHSGNGTVTKSDLIKRYGVTPDYDKCDRGDITTQNGKFVNEGKTEACLIPSEDLPKNLTDALALPPAPATPLKLFTVLPSRVEATLGADVASLNATRTTIFENNPTAPYLVFDGAGGSQLTKAFGGVVLGSAHIESPNLPKRTIVATSNGCLAVDEP